MDKTQKIKNQLNTDYLDDSFAAKAELDIDEDDPSQGNQKCLIEDPARFDGDQSLNLGTIEFAHGIGPSNEKSVLNEAIDKPDHRMEATKK